MARTGSARGGMGVSERGVSSCGISSGGLKRPATELSEERSTRAASSKNWLTRVSGHPPASSSCFTLSGRPA